ncbi:MAG: N-acetyltransferase [Balneolaceae bacterium]
MILSSIVIRQECPSDYPTVFQLNESAFGQKNEAKLVDALRSCDAFAPELSLIALSKDTIVGHILFTKLTIRAESGQQFESLSLAPMAVDTKHQNQGIGSQLVTEGLKIAKSLGYKFIIVLGHPDYYPRFGFQPASQWGIKTPFDVPNNAFLALELTENGLDGVHGTVKYPKEFDSV